MSVHTVLVRKAMEMEASVHMTQLSKAKVSSCYAGGPQLGEYLEDETTSFSAHFWLEGA